MQTPGDPDRPSEQSADDYFLEIESAFASFRGTPFVFSSRDWALMKSWHDEGIPLAIVLEAIESCFRKAEEGKRRRVVSSLSYCRHAVGELWADRRDLYVGAEESVPEADAAGQLDRLASVLSEIAAEEKEESTSRALTTAASSVSGIGTRSVPQIEDELGRIEDALFAQLLDSLDEETRDTIHSELQQRLAQSSAPLNDDVAERTRAANLRGILRTRFRIPRLTLFG